MSNTNTKLIRQIFKELTRMDYVRLEDIPSIDLYMDQVTTFMDQNLSHGKRYPDDKILTKTMINNYTKNRLLTPPEKKKYSREHLLSLIFIYYFKDFLSISDIEEILHPILDHYFHAEDGDLSLEDVYQEVFSLENEEMSHLIRDVLRKYHRSEQTFADAPKESQEELQRFSLLCMLGFDVYIKKMIMTHLIDEMKDLEKKEQE